MNTITQDMHYRQSPVRYAQKHGVSPACRSRKPFSTPTSTPRRNWTSSAGSAAETPFRAFSKFGFRLRGYGYGRRHTGLYRVPVRMGQCRKQPARKKYVPKPYEKMTFPGEHPPRSLFEITLEQMGIRHKLIRPFTPRHNGKVERSHREDKKRFYSGKTFYSLRDFQKQLGRYRSKSNQYPIRPLNWLSPIEFPQEYTVQNA